MKLREFPGALALGLLASLGAHTALYGSSHEMGGAFHSELVSVAVAALGGLLVAFGALAWTGSRHAADGSVLAARLTGRLPGLAPVLVATLPAYLGALTGKGIHIVTVNAYLARRRRDTP